MQYLLVSCNFINSNYFKYCHCEEIQPLYGQTADQLSMVLTFLSTNHKCDQSSRHNAHPSWGCCNNRCDRGDVIHFWRDHQQPHNLYYGAVTHQPGATKSENGNVLMKKHMLQESGHTQWSESTTQVPLTLPHSEPRIPDDYTVVAQREGPTW